MTNSKYFWFKVKETFFEDDVMLWLDEQPNGYEAFMLYMKLCCTSLKNDGRVGRQVGSRFIPHTPKSIAIMARTTEARVKALLPVLEEAELLDKDENGIYNLPYLQDLIGSETPAAAKMRALRKNNAERQQNFRAKHDCIDKDVPIVEDNINKKRYGGNYYTVVKRDNFQCAICGDKYNLCVHHIDGYSTDNPDNNEANKLLTLCRSCHGRVHSGSLAIPDDVLSNIGYNVISNVTSLTSNVTDSVTSNVTDSVTSNVTSNVTQLRRDISRDRVKDISITTTTSDGSSNHDNVFSIWNKEGFPPIREILEDEILDLIEQYGEPKVIYAIREAAKHDVRTFSYVRGVCVGGKKKKSGVPFPDVE